MAANFDIISQVPSTMVNPEGRVVAAVQVTFKTKPSGQTGRVTIVADDYSADTVEHVAGDAATTIEAVQAL